jgi:hypothetical protein
VRGTRGKRREASRLRFRVMILAKYQRCPHDGERVPTQFEIKGNEVEYPGNHVCSRGHLFLTEPDPKPGEETIDTADVQKLG